MRARAAAAVAALTAAVAALAGCASSPTPTIATEPTGGGTVTVFAAASLRDVFTGLGEVFADENPGAEVTFGFAGSSDLASQILEGAAADVFASADEVNMAKVTDEDMTDGAPVAFAGNTLTIVTPPGNPAGITSFADLASPGVAVVVCAPQVPCGAATARAAQAADVTLSPVSEESSVTDVLAKVTEDQADAGLVYVTDAAGAGEAVTTVPFPEAASIVNVYMIGSVRDSARPELADAFVALVTGPVGQQALADAGFQPAP